MRRTFVLIICAWLFSGIVESSEAHTLLGTTTRGNHTSKSTQNDTNSNHSHQSSTKKKYNDSYRITGGYGINYGRFEHIYGAFSAAITFTYQYLFNAFTIRYVGTDAVGTGQVPDQTVQEAALLYGYCFSHSPFFAISAGVGWQKSVLWGDFDSSRTKFGYYMNTNTTIGAAFQAELMFNFTNNLGMGFIYCENINNVLTNGDYILLCFEFGMF